MDNFYIVFVNLYQNSCYLENFCLVCNDCDMAQDIVQIQKDLTSSLKVVRQSNDFGMNCRPSKSLIVRDNGFPIYLEYNGDSYSMSEFRKQSTPCKRLTVDMDGYTLSLFLFCLNSTQNYIELVSKHMSYKLSVLYELQNAKFYKSNLMIRLIQPSRHVMDLLWAKMACKTFYELRQLQYAMSWLSTLGGGFSALGEEQERCAKAAGAISIEQLRIAMKLGDKIVITQCKLYFSLSLIQRGHCRLAKKLILEQYNSLKNSVVVDKKTLNMCKGIWARLKYELHKRRKSSITIEGCPSCNRKWQKKFVLNFHNTIHKT